MTNTKHQMKSITTAHLATVTGGGFSCNTNSGCGVSVGSVNFGSNGTSFDIGGGFTVGSGGVGYNWLKH